MVEQVKMLRKMNVLPTPESGRKLSKHRQKITRPWLWKNKQTWFTNYNMDDRVQTTQLSQLDDSSRSKGQQIAILHVTKQE